MGREIEIQCTANVYIDEYVSEVSDDTLMDEMMSRLDNYSETVKKDFFRELIDYDNDIIVNAISAAKSLSIIDAEKLREFLNNLG